MACCYADECGEYAVTPVLVAPMYASKCEDVPVCLPCLPRCPKGVTYCCEKKPPRYSAPLLLDDRDDCCHTHDMGEDCCHYTERRDSCCSHQHDHHQRAPRSPPPRRSATPRCCVTDEPTCKPVKTKYVIPCYRYEDGRINQPTVLMRRACEVAVGTRVRRKPFVVSSFSADQSGEVRRYHCEDERGNCCYHFERKKPCFSTTCCETRPPYICAPPYSHTNLIPDRHCRPRRSYQPCTSSPECQFVECVQARAVNPSETCCFYV